ncbi:GIY-YIG nuclease family protein [Denitrobaculum tricleocarpae]|uniref:GIY-YIG nuclease family protein n=1 Tax=Denitrobaculum tricleocarpae TaxID=2591009 RepID=A0A545TL64_9PROT|nr:GIY-YIG nuclease family protein [Denitrobaculum tricleocarpae]TQV77959.1 GIY-YIG nuclease family protein [Denitrobaculum tricleocarpae]
MYEREPDSLRDCIAAAGVSGIWTEPAECPALGDVRGAYLLALRLPVERERGGSKRGTKVPAPGWYLYAGSAWGGGGIRARLGRHFRREKKPHWHIDRLTLQAAEMFALAVPGGGECDLVAKLLSSRRFRIAVAGFGSSDCRRCESHLLEAARQGRA